MFTKTPSERTGLDKAIDEVLREMTGHTSDTKEYAAMADQLTKLHAIKDKQSTNRVSADTLAIVAGNLLVALVVVGHEQAHVVTSKALSFMLKLR